MLSPNNNSKLLSGGIKVTTIFASILDIEIEHEAQPHAFWYTAIPIDLGAIKIIFLDLLCSHFQKKLEKTIKNTQTGKVGAKGFIPYSAINLFISISTGVNRPKLFILFVNLSKISCLH